MKRIGNRLLGAALVILTMPWSTFGDSAQNVIATMPKETNAIIYVNLEKARQAAAFVKIKEVFAAERQKMVDQILAKTGVDIDKIKEVWIGGEKKQKGLVLLKGEFSVETIRQAVALNGEEKVQIVSREGFAFAAVASTPRHGGGPKLGVMMNDSTIVAGDQSVVDEFLAVAKGEKEGLPADVVSAAAAFFNETSVVQAFLVGMPQGALASNPTLAGVRGGTFVMDLDSGLKASMDILVSTEEQAIAYEQIINGFAGLGKLASPSDPAKRIINENFLKNLNISRDGNRITISLLVGDTDLSQMIDSVSKVCPSKARPGK